MSERADEVSAELELLDSLERKLLDLDRNIEGDGVGRDAIHSLFRNVHNLKGAVALRGDEEATGLVHCIETALDEMRSGRIGPSRELVDSFLAGADGIRARLSGKRDADCRSLVASMEKAMSGASGPAATGPTPRSPDEALAKAVGFPLSRDELASLRGEIAKGSRIYLAEKFLDGRLAQERVARLPIFETIRGIGRMLALRPEGGKAPEGRESVLSLLFASDLPPGEMVFSVFDPCRELPFGGARRRIGEVLVNMGATDEESIQRALALREAPIGEILVESRRISTGDLERALEIQGASGGGGSGAAKVGRGPDASRRDLRVEAAKLDKLFDLVGELITAEATLAACPEIADRKRRELSKAFDSISKITRELQETTMAVRMVPLEGLFDRMARLVRDLSRKTGKSVDLVVTGGEREMDKNAIEEIADPLAHLVRNAVDHGIEGPAARLAAGKGERGRIELAARYEGSDVLISVSDDGAGIDGEAVLRKAAARGLVPAGSEGRRAEEEEIHALIFLPGFSTTESATEISGRGVGLDVVKRNVERLRGRVDLTWEPGRGTTFLMRMPLTLAIVDAITLRAGSCRYSVPVTDVREFFRPLASQVIRAEGERVALRGEFLPLLRLEGALAAAGLAVEARRPIEESIAVVMEEGGRRACLVVDEVLGAQQVVVRPMPAYAGRVDGLSGCSVNGDGGVGFIVDTGRLMDRAFGSRGGA